MKTFQQFKKTIVEKFDKTVKAATNRAIPIAKKEAARVIQIGSEKTVMQVVELVKAAIIIGTVLMPVPEPVKAVAATPISSLDGVQSLTVNIENLVINM